MPTFFGSTIGVAVLLEVVDQPADAPLPGPQRAPVVRLPRLAFVGQADDAGGQPVVVRLDAGRDDAAIAPALGDRQRRARRARTRAGRKPKENSIMIGTGFFDVGRHREARLDVDRDLRIGAVIHMARPASSSRSGCRRIRRGVVAVTSQVTFGTFGGNAAIHLALEILHDLRPALRPLLRRASPSCRPSSAARPACCPCKGWLWLPSRPL